MPLTGKSNVYKICKTMDTAGIPLSTTLISNEKMVFQTAHKLRQGRNRHK